MFEGFAVAAIRAVEGARTAARVLGSREIGPGHLALAALQHDPHAADALRGAGVDPESVMSRLSEHLEAGSGLDAEALASLGIDLTEVSQAADASFGPGALARAGEAVGPRKDAGLSKLAHAMLMSARHEAVRLGQMPIDGRHLLLAAMQTSAAVADVMTDGADRATVRHALEAQGTPA